MDANHIECQDLFKIYPTKQTDVVALRGLDLNVASGEFVGVLGSSGSGKTTLLRILGGFERPSAGTVSIGGWNLDALEETAVSAYRREAVGFVWQRASENLIPYMTAEENVMAVRFFSRFNQMQWTEQELLQMVDLAKHSNSKASHLSGGEQQRLSIAVALANEPGLLLVDEPTGELDSDSGRYIWQVLKNVGVDLGTTIVAVTHDESVYDVADRILYISDGRIDREHLRMYGKPDEWEEYRVIDRTGRISLPEKFLMTYKGKTRARVVGFQDDLRISLKELGS
jgi:putative ABC transport system ATP-binding protein